MTYLIPILTGITLGIAWLVPDTVFCVVLGWISAVGIVYILKESSNRHLPLYFVGLISHCIAFTWLTDTISMFGGFNYLLAILIFALFVVTASLQFGVVALLYRRLPKSLDRYNLRSAISWITAETLFIRIFPWYLGHTQLSFTSFAQIADIGGVAIISFFMVYIADALYSKRYLPLLPFFAILIYGMILENYIDTLPADSQSVAVIQGNLSIIEKRNVRYFSTNVARYEDLSKQHENNNTLIIWPESVLQEFLPTTAKNISDYHYFPTIRPMLYGALGATPPRGEERFNSAFGTLADGTVLEPYHKRILMPFGEYMPFANILPFLNDMNPNIANFTAGKNAMVMSFPLSNHTVKLSPLICYEDIVPSLAKDSVNMGAELLVNLTNDAWFGKSAAPYQHHQIAAFRAIENRRFLVRSTNTGLTAIVSATGKTLQQLPVFSEGTLLASVKLLRYNSLYSRWGEFPWYAISVITILFALRKRYVS